MRLLSAYVRPVLFFQSSSHIALVYQPVYNSRSTLIRLYRRNFFLAEVGTTFSPSYLACPLCSLMPDKSMLHEKEEYILLEVQVVLEEHGRYEFISDSDSDFTAGKASRPITGKVDRVLGIEQTVFFFQDSLFFFFFFYLQFWPCSTALRGL